MISVMVGKACKTMSPARKKPRAGKFSRDSA